jgi:hypothetical protein
MRVATLAVVIVLLHPSPGAAQAWNIDARTVGMAGIAGDQNVFAAAVAESREGRSFVVPLGLIQALLDKNTFNTSSRDFDPARLVEYAGNPLHLQFGRSRSSAGASFVHDVRNSSLSRDLNDYRGFVPASFAANGMASPKWGHSFALNKAGSGPRHSIYGGGGPQLALQTRLHADPILVDVLGADAPAYVGRQRFGIDNQTTGQLVAAMTGGYRGRFPLAATTDEAFVSLNVNYLHGIRYEEIDLALRLETDESGHLSSETGAPPLAFDRNVSSKGRGMSLDVGAGFVAGRWEVGVSASNLAHRLTWRNLTQRTYSLNSLFSGLGRFDTTSPIPLADVRSSVPVDYRGNLAFRGRTLSLQSEIGREFDRLSFRGGVEHALSRIHTRVAAAYVDDTWHPTAGLSVGLSRRLWIDLAGFTTSANVERQQRFALATSIRIAPASSNLASGRN